jgi:hypothetical protein
MTEDGLFLIRTRDGFKTMNEEAIMTYFDGKRVKYVDDDLVERLKILERQAVRIIIE